MPAESAVANAIPPSPPGHRSMRCLRCNMVQNIPLSKKGFACWQCNQLNLVESPAVGKDQPADTKEWLAEVRKENATDAGDPGKKWTTKKIMAAVAAAVAVPVLGYMFYSAAQDEKTVAEMRSDDPAVQAFYDKLVERGYGTMRSGDAENWARAMCRGGSTMLLWGKRSGAGGPYGPQDSFSFSLIAYGFCGAPDKQ
jgi:hypothetical protein